MEHLFYPIVLDFLRASQGVKRKIPQKYSGLPHAGYCAQMGRSCIIRPAMSQDQVVSETGASGYIRSQVVPELLEMGFRVRGTARGVGMGFVDVRDVARAHILAMTVEEARGRHREAGFLHLSAPGRGPTCGRMLGR
jgi:hypothetical protein